MSANGSNNFLNIEDANLRVRSGSVHAQGMTIGGITVAASHGLQSVSDVSNTTSNTLQFTNATTAFKATSNIELTSASKIVVDSNVVTEYTGPHDRPLRKYPEVLTGDVTPSSPVAATSPFTGLSQSWGGYTTIYSSRYNSSGDYNGIRVYDADFGSANPWISGNNTYGTSDGLATSGTSKDTFQNIDGSYITLNLPNRIRISHVCIYNRDSSTTRAPKDGIIWGSSDGGSTFTQLRTFSNLSETQGIKHTLYITSTSKYDIIVVQITAMSGFSSTLHAVAIGEIEYYGYEEGSGSLDTTLKSVYNVPATTGTQLEVYYDAKGESTVQSPIPDLSPNTNTGALSTSPPTLDTTDGIDSFKFNGSSQYITSTHGLSVPGQPIHSQCVWFKTTGDTGDYQYISVIGTTSANQHAAIIIQDDGRTLIGSYFGGDRKMITITPNVWYHVALVYTGTTTDAAKYYINGEEVITTSAFGAAPTTPTITGTTLKLGANTVNSQLLQGSIANFRLYSKALNADQVKELYDYQKDYFLGSKSQVTLYKGRLGVGVTEPSGQLELAGDERIQEYPPRALRQYTTHVEGHGVFTVRASAELNQTGDNDRAWKLFTKIADNSNYWTPTGGTTTYGYSSSDGYTTAYHETAGVKGHWVQLQLPYKIKLHSVKIAAGISTRQAKDATVFGSNDGGNTWTSVGGWTDNNVDDFTLVTFSMNNVGYYSLYRLVITRNGGNVATTLSELQFFGTPGPTTLDKGSLTLGRSLDVPRVSRYDVDTETPRPEKLVVDFDTTVNSSPTDISGKGSHGTFNGTDMNYSVADKAFVFNGSDDLIRATVPVTANFAHSVSVWIKVDTVGNNTFFSLGNETTVATDLTRKSSTIYTTASGFSFVFFGGDMTIPFSYSTGRWYHVVGTRDTGGTYPNTQKFYIDGVDYSGSASWTNSSDTTLALPTTATLLIGKLLWATSDRFDGQISNFKLYNVALEPSEVKKLYNMGRTGRSMVISDTAVGIGKVPEAQLDVRGNIKCDVIMPRTIAFSAYASSGNDSSTTGVFPGNATLYNFGNAYDTSTYRFTAPVNGVYHFEWNAFTNQSATTTSRIFLLKNGNIEVQKGNSIERHGNGISINLYLDAGDYITINGSSSYPLYYYGFGGHNHFSGHLVHATQ